MNLTYLVVTYVLTIILARIFLSFYPIHGKKIGSFQPHHYMHGIILVLAYFLFPKASTWAALILGVGLGLIVDEIPLFFIFKGWNWPDNHWKQYHSKKSIVGIVLVTFLGYLLIRALR